MTGCKKVSFGLRIVEVAGIALITIITWDIYKAMKAHFKAEEEAEAGK